MNQNSAPKSHTKAIDIIEQMQKLGFPNKNNIQEFDKLIKQLQSLSLDFKDPAHAVSLNLIIKTIETIKKKIKENGAISVYMYTKLYDRIAILKENLIAFS